MPEVKPSPAEVEAFCSAFVEQCEAQLVRPSITATSAKRACIDAIGVLSRNAHVILYCAIDQARVAQEQAARTAPQPQPPKTKAAKHV